MSTLPPSDLEPTDSIDTRSPASSAWSLQTHWTMWLAALAYFAYLYERSEHGSGQLGNVESTFVWFAMWILPVSLPFLLFSTWRQWRLR